MSEIPSSEDTVPAPFRVRYSETAEANLDEAYRWLAGFSLAGAERWLAGLLKAVEREAEARILLPGYRSSAPDAAAFPGRDIFVFLYRTGGRHGSPWHVLYELYDENGDGEADTLVVAYVRHAAASSAQDKESS